MVVYYENIIPVNWAYFYKLKKEGGGRGTEYQEDKDKFYKATNQINESIVAIHDKINLMSQAELENYHKVIPIIITNATICLMEIDKKKVSFSTIPWVLYKNNFKVDRSNMISLGNLNYLDNYDFKDIFIVNFDYCKKFIDILLSRKNDFGKYPRNSHKNFHHFSI